MKKLIKILLTVSMLFTCFGVNVIADGLEDLLIESDDTYTGGNYECANFTIASGITLTLQNDGNESPRIEVFGNITIEGTLDPCQDATIRVQPGCSFSGIQLWDPPGENEITSIENPVDFVYIQEMGKWVQGLEDKKFDSDFEIDTWYEFGNVEIDAGVTLSFTGDAYLCVRGSFDNNGTLAPVDGSIIALNSSFEGIDLYEADTETPVVSPLTEYVEFIYLGGENKWVRYIRPQNVAIEYDDEKGSVYHYVDGTFTYLQQEWKDDGEGPYRNFFYNMDQEDTFYIKAKDGYVFDHIEAEGDDPQNPGNRIINEEPQQDVNIGGVDYKVVKVSANPKDDNFYFLQFIFGDDPDVANKKLAENLNTLELAFDSTTGEANNNAELKEYIAHSIYSRYLEQGSRYRIENTVFEDCDFNDFKGKVEIITEGTPTKTPVKIDGNASTYFLFELDGLDNFIGIVYKLSGTDEFILRDGNTYTVIDVSEEAKLASEGQGAAALKDFKAVQGGKIVVREVNNTVNREESETGPNYEIFGNYAGFPMNYTGFMQDYQDTRYISIERVWACAPESIDISAFSSLNCEMILYSKNFLGVCIKSDENAQPWSSDNLPIYPTNSGSEEATVFYASSEVEILTPYGAPSGSTISSITFADGSTSWNDCSISNNVVTFGSIFYDKVPLKITYTNGTSKTFTIARTGISIGDYPAPGGSNSVDVCGVTVNFTDDNKWLIAAPFYYANTSPGASDRVSLFVKITDNSGNVSTKLVSSPLNNSIKDDGSNDTYSKYDVFELWRGKESERPQKIEVIAFVNGDAENFGGVKLGSGNGVKWTKERGRK